MNKKKIVMILYGYPVSGATFAPAELEVDDIREVAETWAWTLTPVVSQSYTLKIDIYGEDGLLMYARRLVSSWGQGEWGWKDGDPYDIVRDETPFIVIVDRDVIVIKQKKDLFDDEQ